MLLYVLAVIALAVSSLISVAEMALKVANLMDRQTVWMSLLQYRTEAVLMLFPVFAAIAIFAAVMQKDLRRRMILFVLLAVASVLSGVALVVPLGGFG